jgi:hypothetical protein
MPPITTWRPQGRWIAGSQTMDSSKCSKCCECHRRAGLQGAHPAGGCHRVGRPKISRYSQVNQISSQSSPHAHTFNFEPSWPYAAWVQCSSALWEHARTLSQPPSTAESATSFIVTVYRPQHAKGTNVFQRHSNNVLNVANLIACTCEKYQQPRSYSSCMLLLRDNWQQPATACASASS